MPPKKGKKMDLNAFLMDESTGGGSWADEMDMLPTASGDPGSGTGLGGSHLRQQQDRGGFGDRSGRGDFMDRPPRAEVPMPTAPPFTAYVGNLTFETVEPDLEDFFAGMPTTSIRLVSGPDNKPKGFGYVEFQTLDGLKAALALTGSDVNGRIVRISVAEAPKGREGRADEDMTWERQGPLAPLAGRSGGFDRPRQEGFGSSAGAGGADVERDGPIRGGKFVASPAGAGGPGGRFGGGERNFSGQSAGAGGFDRPRGEFGAGGPGGEEVVRDGPIRGGKFVPAPPAQERFGGGGDRFGGGDRRASGPADEQREWTRQGPLAPVAGARQSSFGAPRTGGSFGDQTPPSGDSSPQPQRQRLQLSARSAASSTPSSPPTSPAPSSRPSPFGAARPVNQATRDAEIEAKLSSEREAVAAKLAAEKVRRERDPALAEGVVAGAKKGASPFGAAKPVDVREKEREVEEKLEKARKEAAAKLAEKKEVKRAEVPKEVAAAAAPAPAAGAPKSPQLTKAGLRKEGFSYSSIAVAKDAAVDEVTKKVEETSI